MDDWQPDPNREIQRIADIGNRARRQVNALMASSGPSDGLMQAIEAQNAERERREEEAIQRESDALALAHESAEREQQALAIARSSQQWAKIAGIAGIIAAVLSAIAIIVTVAYSG